MDTAKQTEDSLLDFDRLLHVWISRYTSGISPAALAQAFFDWAIHLGLSPAKQHQLVDKAVFQWMRLLDYCAHAPAASGQRAIEPLVQDNRFESGEWQAWPYNAVYQSFLLGQQWWHYATTDVRGVTDHHEQVVNFTMRQLLDIFSPSNFFASNPEVIQATGREHGQNLLRGWQNWLDDVQRHQHRGKPAGADLFRVGHEVAVTPGKVVFRNRLIELIQYAPSTDTVAAEPILIVPSWIMKYYILDLSPHNSLVRFLVEQGHTVFMLSWKNPDAGDRNLMMDDYLKLGVLAALDHVSSALPGQRINAAGYCLGGTLLAIAAAWLAGRDDQRLNTVTLFAAQVDFDEPGELSLFIEESQLAFLEDVMWDKGYLRGGLMHGAFELLNSRDLFWSRLTRDYLLGTRLPLNDLMAWNADATRMPYRMHTEYLRRLYGNNELATGQYHIDGKTVALTDIRAPICAVGTTKDHVSPWKSVYKIRMLSDADVTFVLVNGGHNAGIVSEPGHAHRVHQVRTQLAQDKYLSPDEWQRSTPVQEGSWWPTWDGWLRQHNGAGTVPARQPDETGLGDAPGSYVLLA
ncbi:alpha/beta fold hydrolase [Chitinivorax sp. PXF-14]|uniref:PHA/PHB synthase family protein n=1 Tax=Chitinivorax sp. PXF-14 TaxID=3230488 RepID=UPI003466A0BB